MLEIKRFLEDQIIIRSESNQNPDISVIMPTYCRGEVSLRRAIKSVLNQTFTNFELIIVDDGSRDGTFDILKEYQKIDNRIVIIKHTLNSGLPALRVNEGIMLARGKYIAYQFDDDEYLPNCLDTLYRAIELQDNPCLVYGTCEVQVKQANGEIREISLGKPFNYGLLVGGNYIANNSVLHHKSIIYQSGLYDPHIVIRRFSDYDLWLRMSKKVPFIWVDSVVTKVFAGEKDSLGVDVDYSLDYIRKYLEISRDHLLVPGCILDYDVDDLNKYCLNYNQLEIDYLNRFMIIPFLNKITYYLKSYEMYIANVSRPRIRSLAVTKVDFSTSVDVTIKNYTHRINRFPYKYFFINEASLNALVPENYDLLILYRTIGRASLDILTNNKKNKKPTLYMIDDNMFKFHELGAEYSYLKPDTPSYRYLEEQVSKSDLVISYNTIITEDCKKYNDKVSELKTNIPAQLLENSRKNFDNETIKIAMFSGMVRKKELKEILPAIKKIKDKYGAKVEFHFWGINPNELDEIDFPVYYKPFTHSYDQYIDALLESNFQYHICPLNGGFDAAKSKSPIKFLEGTIAGAVGLFSNVKPYDQIPNGLCIKTENTLDNWYKCLHEAVNRLEKDRKEILERAKDYILSSYSTESLSHDFICSLEAGELHSKLADRKIAYFIHEAYLGGATLHLIRHALMARSYGFTIILCTTAKDKSVPDLPMYASNYGLEVHYLNFTRKVSAEISEKDNDVIQNSIQISCWLTENEIGLVHSATFIPEAGIACKINSIPHVATLHQFYPSTVSSGYLKRNVLIDIIHSSSNRYARIWSETLGVPSRRMCCPVDREYFSYYDYNLGNLWGNSEIRILVSGTLQDRKNQLNAIKAIKILKDRGYNVKLNLIGYDNLKKDYVNECRQAINDLDLTNDVKILGFINCPEKYYFGVTEILLCCSTDESMPQTILQAMASGIFVVSTEVGGVKEIIKDNYNGVLCEGSDYEFLADSLEKAIKLNSKIKYELIKNAFDTVKMVAYPAFICSELLNLYNEAFELAGKHPLPDLINKKLIQKTDAVESIQLLERNRLIALSDKKQIPLALSKNFLIKNNKIYTFKAEADNLIGLRLMFETKRNEGEPLIMIISSANKPDYILRNIELAGNLLKDSYVDCFFDTIENSLGQQFYVTFGNQTYKTLLERIRYKFGISNSLYGFGIYKN